MVTESQFAFLRSIDTPTVCNLMEIVAPERRGSFYTVKHLHCPFPDLPPMVGFAKTVTMRARDNVGGSAGAFLGGIAWTLGGWGGCVATIFAMQLIIATIVAIAW